MSRFFRATIRGGLTGGGAALGAAGGAFLCSPSVVGAFVCGAGGGLLGGTAGDTVASWTLDAIDSLSREWDTGTDNLDSIVTDVSTAVSNFGNTVAGFFDW